MLAKINEFAPIIEALSVSGSFVFVIWVSCFRKTRQDRIDELKEEMRILLSDRGIIGMGYDDIDEFLGELAPKFQKGKYKRVQNYALKELVREGRLQM